MKITKIEFEKMLEERMTQLMAKGKKMSKLDFMKLVFISGYDLALRNHKLSQKTGGKEK